MAKLTGLQIQKLLPKTNCKECGSNTCLAFAMKLAAQKADLSECPYASDEAKKILGAASEPPVKGIELGPEKKLRLGEETVLYRHEKTFVNQTALAVNVNDTDSTEKIDKALSTIAGYVLERVGEKLIVDLVCVTEKSGDSAKFAEICLRAFQKTKRPVIMRSGSARCLSAAASAVKGAGGVIASANPSSADELVKAAQDNGHALAVTAPDLDQLSSLTSKIRDSGFASIILEFQAHSLSEQFQVNSIARRAALKDSFKPFGYPSIRFIEGEDVFGVAGLAVNEITKYGGICVLPFFDPALLASLMTLRLNIYTDPQKPIQVEPKLYPIGEPDRSSPVFVTTNFSLTYFIVSGEIENSGTSAWLIVPECEGMSVLTAWAAGKFSGASIAKFMREIEVEKQVDTRQIIIPGYVAQISGELEESLPGWKVAVGPQEAADIESYVKAKLR